MHVKKYGKQKQNKPRDVFKQIAARAAAGCLAVYEWVKRRPLLLYSALFVFGALIAYGIISRYHFLTQDQLENLNSVYMGARQSILNYFFNALRAGEIMDFGRMPAQDGMPGYYILLSYLSRILGKPEAWQMFLIVQSAGGFILLAVYPALIYRTSKSLPAALFSPFLIDILCGDFIYRVKTDGAWSMAWVIVLGVPLLYILLKNEWDKRGWAWFGVLCLVMSLGNVPRVHASLPIAFLLVVILAYKLVYLPVKKNKEEKTGDRKKDALKLALRLLPFAASIIILFFSYDFLVNGLGKAYTFATGQKDVIFTTKPWHTAYIGFGFEENKYGITYSDSCAYSKALETNPNVRYLSDEYMNILRNEYFKIMREDLKYFAGSYYRKFMQNIKMVMSFLPFWRNDIYGDRLLYFIAVYIVLLCAKFKEMTKKYFWLMLGAFSCVFTGMAQAMIAVPGYRYLLPSFAAGNLVLFYVVIIGIEASTGALYERLKKYLTNKTGA